jgi:CMP/dCMP kinase
MKQILVIDREFGAGCSRISQKIATRLNWKLFDDQLSREIAELANIPVDLCREREERPDPVLQRLINLIWRGSFDRNLPSPDLAILDTDRLVGLMRQAVELAAQEQPCVIVGRGAPYFLRNRTDTLTVFLYASRERRFRQVLERTADEREAIRLVDSMDDDRRKFVKHYFGYDWPNRELFHAMLNTAVGDGVTVDAIVRLLESVNANEPSRET